MILDPEGTVLATAPVGALPDMVTFDEDGKRVLVANEGEPVRYVANADGAAIDPEGTVSIISLRGLDKGDDRCEVDDDREDETDDDRGDEKDDDRGDEKDDDREDEDRRENDDDRRPTASPAAQAVQDDVDDEDDDSRGGRGTRSRGDDDRDDDSRPTASPVATAPTSPRHRRSSARPAELRRRRVRRW